jgi:hypothetical protein
MRGENDRSDAREERFLDRFLVARRLFLGVRRLAIAMRRRFSTARAPALPPKGQLKSFGCGVKRP